MLSLSALASRRGIDKRIGDEASPRAAVHLARTVPPPIRDAFGSDTRNSVGAGAAACPPLT